MLSRNLMEKIVDYIMSHGGDFAEIYEEDTIRSQITMTGGRIGEALSGRESGVGIRILQGEECIYLHSGDSREENLWKLLNENWIREGMPARGWKCPEEYRRFPELREGCAGNASMKEKTALLESCDREGLAYSSKISQMRFKYLDMDQQVQIFNSEGLFAGDRRRKTRLFMEAVARDGKDVDSAYYGPGAMQDFGFYKSIDVRQCVRDTAAAAVKHLGAGPCPTGLMPVVIANGFCGLFFHEACGHSLEAAAAADGGSEFSGRLGEQVAASKVTLIDDGSIQNGWGSGYIDDEGMLTRKNILIENGVLKNYLVDRVNGKKLGMQANGCSRRQSYRFAPTSRMSNTYIAAGNDNVEKMIASVERGIYVKNINAGSVNSMTGEFNFNTGETYLIEHGEITVPVHSATLIGVGRDILQKVDQVGDDLRIGQGFCYAGSGALYISAGQPTLKVSEMSVGGDVVC